MSETGLVQILEGALLAAGKPLTVAQLADLFEEHECPEKEAIREALQEVAERCEDRGFELQEVASGFRFQVRQSLSTWVARLWHERPQKYSRALLETLALIAYRQPITRGDIEEIRGVSVSSNITRQLLERDWVRVVGHRDVPGRPAMFGTTKGFLDYFSLKKLDDLPPLADLADWENLRVQLNLPEVEGLDGSGVAGEIEVKAAESGSAVEASAENALPVLYPEGEEGPTEEEAVVDAELTNALQVIAEELGVAAISEHVTGQDQDEIVPIDRQGPGHGAGLVAGNRQQPPAPDDGTADESASAA